MSMNLFKRGIALIISLSMILGMVVPVSAVESDQGGIQLLPFHETEVDFDFRDPSIKVTDENIAEAALVGPVRVSIVLEENSTLEMGFSTIGIADNANAMAYRDSLKLAQKRVEDRITATGVNLDVVWNLTLAANIISAYVDAADIDAIENVPGVKEVVVETQYAPAVIDDNLPVDPNMATSSAQIGSGVAYAENYTGAGSTVAIVDTGIDDDHELFDADAFDYSIEEVNAEREKAGLDPVKLMTKEYVASKLSELNSALQGYNIDDIYMSSKVPFAFNYVDKNTITDHDHDTQGEHGSHVTGIAAGNKYVKRGDEFVSSLDTVHTQGVAPDAQIITMKVFGAKGGAYDSDYMAAIEDAVILGASAINLSLGSSNPGFSKDYTYSDILEKVANSGTVLSISAGNNGTWTENSYSPAGLPFDDDVVFHTGGSPGSYTETLGVASVDNVGFTGNYLTVNGKNVFYTESTGYTNPAFSSKPGEYGFVYLDSVGLVTQTLLGMTINAEDQLSKLDKIEPLKGKVVLCNRGVSNFSAKANAAAKLGAAGIIIVNNQPGTINMDLSDYTGTVPVVSITQADGELFKAALGGTVSTTYDALGNKVASDLNYYTGKVTSADGVASDPGTVSQDNIYTMSSFSSWGVPGSLEMKPEITAPGGNIYSVNGAIAGGHSYENMSGTSMAAPQVTGMAAVVAQRVRDEGLEASTGLRARQIANSLLMSTAVPVHQADGSYYSILNQGSGLANVGNAVTADAVIMMEDDATASYADGKVKVELGDYVNGQFQYNFTITNTSDEANTYTFRTDLFTQKLNNGYLDTATTTIPVVSEKYLVDGAPVEKTNSFDVNRDGKTDEADAQAVLDYVVKGVNNNYDLGAADANADGEITTFDANYILTHLNPNEFTLEPGEEVTVTVQITFDTALLSQYKNGAYVEGYTFVEAGVDEEGVVTDVDYSIPILGFSGDWSAPSMYERITAYEWFLWYDAYQDGLVDFNALPDVYTYDKTQGFDLINILTLKDGETREEVYMQGNPYFADEHIERAAVRSIDTLNGYLYSLIRNAGGLGVVVTEGEGTDGNVLWSSEVPTAANGAFYYTSGGTWQYTSGKSNIGVNVASLGLNEGDTFTTTLVAAPEYYTMDMTDEDGNIDKDQFANLVHTLGDGAKMSTTLTIDDTKPELLAAYREYGTDDLTLEVKDNQYVAAIMIASDTGELLFGGLPNQTAPGQVCGMIVPAALLESMGEYNSQYGSGAESTDFIVVVADYANNTRAYMFDGTGYNEVEPTAIDIPDAIRVPTGGTADVKVTYTPSIVTSAELNWKIEDTSIATVNDGVLTGLQNGTTTLTVTYVNNPEVTDTATVTVAPAPSAQLDGLVYDVDGTTYWSTFNTSTPYAFQKLGQGSTYRAGSMVDIYDSAMITHDGSSVYAVDPVTYNASALFSINPTYLFPDAAPNNFFANTTAGEKALLAPEVNSDILMIFLPYSAGLYTVDLSSRLSSPIAAITFAGLDSSSRYDYYYMILENGDLYQLYLSSTGSLGYGLVGSTGLDLSGTAAGDGTNTASMIYPFTNRADDKEVMYLATYFDGDDAAQINVIEVDFSDSGDIEFCGVAGKFSFGSDVWPAVALYEPLTTDTPMANVRATSRWLNQVPFAVSERMYAGIGEPVVEADPVEPELPVDPELPVEPELPTEPETPTEPEPEVTEPVAPVEPEPEVTEPTRILGTLNGIKIGTNPNRTVTVKLPTANSVNTDSNLNNDGVVIDPTKNTVTITVRAEDTTNGYAKISYDKDVLTYKNIAPLATYAAYKSDVDNGEAFFGFAFDSVRPLTGDVAEITFFYNDDPITTNTNVTITVIEDGTVTYGDDQPSVDIPLGHTWSDPTWTWNMNSNPVTASAKFVCSEHEGDDQVIEATITSDTVDATCTEAGKTTYTATVTGPDGNKYIDTKEVTISAKGHTPVVVPGKDPTCTEPGLTDGQECSVCGETLKEQTEIPATGHAWGTWVVVTEPTESTEGKAEHKCTNDETHVDTLTLPVLTDETFWTKEETKAPTCEAEGTNTYTAKEYEGIVITVTVDALGHDMPAEWTDSKDGTHHERTCTRCDYKETEEHKWDAGKVTKPATHTENGEKIFACTVCGATKTEVVEKESGHTFGPWTVTKAPTETETGTAERKCTVDDGGIETIELPVLTDETFWTKEETKAPTCEAEGTNTYTAKEYEEIVITVTVDALGHDMPTEWTDSKDGTHHERTCTRCDYKETEEHKWDAGKVTKPATHTENGEMLYTCTVCSATKTEAVEKESGHTFGPWAVTKAPTETETGTAERKCTVDDGGIEKIDLPVLNDIEFWNKEVTKAATCEADGTTTYTAKKYDGIKVEVTVNALGHKYGEPVWTWSSDSKTATATFTCANDSTHVQVVNATVTSTTVLPSLTTPGATTYTAAAVFEGRTYTAQNVVVIPIPGPTGNSHLHTWVWDFDAVSHRQLCSGCGMYLNYGPHNFVNGVCIDCGYVADVIDVNTPIEDTDQNSEEETSGDDLTVDDTQAPVESNPETGLAVSALTLAMAAVATAFSKRR